MPDRKHVARKPAKKAAETTVEPDRNPRTVAELLGTKDTQKQMEAIYNLDRAARTPAFCISLYLDPRPEPLGGFQIAVVGPDIPYQAIRQMLAMANEEINKREVEERSKKEQVTEPVA